VQTFRKRRAGLSATAGLSCLKKAQPTGFWGFIGFCALPNFLFFYLNVQLGSLLVDLLHQLSSYLDSPVIQII